ncbi:hypothetical protein PG984_014626 [Apiospora sp. TS-2023a]
MRNAACAASAQAGAKARLPHDVDEARFACAPPEAAVPNLNILTSPADKTAGWLGCIAGSREQPLKAPFPSNGALSMIQGGCALFAADA